VIEAQPVWAGVSCKWLCEREKSKLNDYYWTMGADLNACDKLGKTASQLTSESEGGIVKLLSEYGAKSAK